MAGRLQEQGTRRDCYLLAKSDLSTAVEVAKWAYKGYGLRWKIEEYHRHVKQGMANQ